MVLVTGGTGLLGSHLLYHLIRDGQTVRAIFRSEEKQKMVKCVFESYDSSHASELFEKIDWVRADVLDIPSLAPVFEGIEIVYHLAGVVSYARKDFNRMMKVNREGTANIVNYALKFGVKKFCHISSTSAVSINYEDRKAPLIEANKWVQTTSTSGYAISKYSAEKEVWRGIEEGLNAVIINPSVILGAGVWGQSSLQIPALAAKGFPFYSKGTNAFVDVRDVVFCMIESIRQDLPSDRYLCTGNAIAFRDLMNLFADELKMKRPRWKANRFLSKTALFLDFIKGLFTHKRTLTTESIKTAFSTTYYDSSKIKKALNFEFRSIEETVRFTVEGRLE